MLHRFCLLLLTAVVAANTYAIDVGNESTADKADRFEFEEFHKEKGVVIWEEKKPQVATSADGKTADSKNSENKAPENKIYEKGDTLKVREAYKLGSDPALRSTQSLYEATEALHKQLNGLCPSGWLKEREWHMPEAGHFYIYYKATCL